jgi:hypothetical protein
VAVRKTRLSISEVQALIDTLLSKGEIKSTDLLAFARSVNAVDFHDAPAAKPKGPKGPSVAEIKQQLLAHFQCSTVAALKKDHNF